MNPLFWVLLIAVTTAISLHVRWTRHRIDTSLPRELDPSAHPDWPLSEDSWSIEALDFLATSDRIRAALRVRLDEGDAKQRRRAMELLAHRLYRHLQVQAIFVETTSRGRAPDRYLFAADGRGWRGDKFVSRAFFCAED